VEGVAKDRFFNFIVKWGICGKARGLVYFEEIRPAIVVYYDIEA
jgi:hypothetical protein